MQKKYAALLLAAVLGASMLTGCGRKPEPTTDEAILFLMEREILRRDRELPPEYIQYHIEHGLPVEEEESSGVRTILKEIGRYLPDEVNDYISQADQIMQGVGDAASQAQDVLDQLDGLTSGSGKDLLDTLTSGNGREIVDELNSGEGREILDQLTSGEGREIIDELTSGAGGELIDSFLSEAERLGLADDVAQNGCTSMDDAVKAYYGSMYEKDLSLWRCILPDDFAAQHPNYTEPFAEKVGRLDPETCLPGGMESLTYTIEEDLTEEYATGGEDWDTLRELYAAYGVTEIDGVWKITTNWDASGGSVDTELIVRSGDRYYVPYPLEKLDAYYNEQW